MKEKENGEPARLCGGICTGGRGKKARGGEAAALARRANRESEGEKGEGGTKKKEGKNARRSHFFLFPFRMKGKGVEKGGAKFRFYPVAVPKG